MNVPRRPKLTDAARPATFTVEAYDETGAMKPTPIAGEHPLTLYVDKREIVTLMTLGQAPEALAIGYLRNQRLVKSIEDIEAVQIESSHTLSLDTFVPKSDVDEVYLDTP